MHILGSPVRALKWWEGLAYAGGGAGARHLAYARSGQRRAVPGGPRVAPASGEPSARRASGRVGCPAPARGPSHRQHADSTRGERARTSCAAGAAGGARAGVGAAGGARAGGGRAVGCAGEAAAAAVGCAPRALGLARHPWNAWKPETIVAAEVLEQDLAELRAMGASAGGWGGGVWWGGEG